MTEEEARSCANQGMQLVTGKGLPQNIPLGLALLHSAAEADNHDAQLALFLWYSERDPKQADMWFHRSEKTKPRPPGVTYSDPKSGGCASVLVLGVALLTWTILST